ncbi:MAG: class I SAM-dependent methyltransferase [Desulforhopalus sp.]
MDRHHLTSRTHQHLEDDRGKSFDSRYLAAKKTIDDRAINQHVWETLRRMLPHAADGEPVKILELGAGIGTMLERLVDWRLLTGNSTYLATDMDPGHLTAARKYLSQWAARHGHSWSWTDGGGKLCTAKAEISLTLEPARIEELAVRAGSLGPFHLIIAHAVLDLVDFPAVLPQFLARLAKNGLAYFTCNFDGDTVFLPHFEGEREIIRRYHTSMEERLSGASHTGRRLLAFLPRAGSEILAAGSSDWIIHPRGTGYSFNETFFLHAIIDTVANQLAREECSPSERATLTTWTRLRHQQVENNELIFLARHLDLLVQHHPALP